VAVGKLPGVTWIKHEVKAMASRKRSSSKSRSAKLRSAKPKRAAARVSKKGKRGIAFFYAKDAVDQATTGMRELPIQMSPGTKTAFEALFAAGYTAGARSELLVRQEKGFSLLMVTAKPNYPFPRHSHSSDCMYFVAAGSIRMGNRVLGPGDGFFVPGDVVYVYAAGPEGAQVLEIRYGVNSYSTILKDAPAAAWKADLDTVKANADRWKAMDADARLAAE